MKFLLILFCEFILGMISEEQENNDDFDQQQCVPLFVAAPMVRYSKFVQFLYLIFSGFKAIL